MANIGAQLRDNPLPLLLISAGVGLMMSRRLMDSGYHGGMGMYRDDDAGDMMRRTADPTAGFGNDRDDYRSRSSSGGMLSSVRDAMNTVTDRVSSQASSLTDTMRGAYSSSMDRVSDMTGRAGDYVSDMGGRAGDYTNRARSGLSTLATEQPLVLGALGLLAGAALAAMLPRTQMEEEYVGSAAAQLRDQATSMAQDTYERAKSAASKAAEAATEAAQQEFSGAGSSDQQGQQSGQQRASGSSGGPTQTSSSSGMSSPGGTSAAGAKALGAQSGTAGARPSETIAAGSSGQGSQRSGA
jgi:hypothetical protein